METHVFNKSRFVSHSGSQRDHEEDVKMFISHQQFITESLQEDLQVPPEGQDGLRILQPVS